MTLGPLSSVYKVVTSGFIRRFAVYKDRQKRIERRNDRQKRIRYDRQKRIERRKDRQEDSIDRGIERGIDRRKDRHKDNRLKDKDIQREYNNE